jgi:hypothetical protein
MESHELGRGLSGGLTRQRTLDDLDAKARALRPAKMMRS